MGISLESSTEFNINHGLELNRPVDPLAGSVYLATDTGKMFVCYENGVWQSASPLSVNSDGTLTFNGQPLVSPNTVLTTLSAAASFTASEDMFGLMLNPNGCTAIISTAAPFTGITDESIICAQSRYPQNQTNHNLRVNNKVIKKGETVYVYARQKGYTKMEDVLAELVTFSSYTSSLGYLYPDYRKVSNVYLGV